MLLLLLLLRALTIECADNEVPQDSAQFTVSPDYNKDNPPGNKTTCRLRCLITDIQRIDQYNQEMQLEMHLLVFWQDSRVQLQLPNDSESLSLGPKAVSSLWLPDVYVIHQRELTQLKIFVEPQQLMLFPDGNLRMATFFSIVVGCRMDFRNFPFDRQRCRFQMESYRYLLSTMEYEWHPDGMDLPKDIGLENFEFTLVVTNMTFVEYGPEKYPALAFEFLLHRQLSYYIVQVFLPQVMFVVISWCSFFVPPDLVPGRMTLCVTTVLTVSTMYAAVKNGIPVTSYFKAIELFGVVNVAFVFAVLIHYSNILRILSKDKLMSAVAPSSPLDVQDKTKESPPTESTVLRRYSSASLFHSTQQTPKKTPSPPPSNTNFTLRAAKYDNIAKVVFPLVYTIFLTTFGLHYTMSN